MRNQRILYSWAGYDFANTIFSAVVLTFYFPLYLTALTPRNVHLGAATTLAMVLAGMAVPGLGALSDRTGRTKSYLLGTTLLCVGFTALLSFFTTVPSLIAAFLAACFFFHASLVFYNALLPAVAEESRQGFASGLGTGLGYLGVLFSIPLAHWVDSTYGRRFVFLSAAVLFLIFSLPLFAWVPERKKESPVPPQREISEIFRSIRQKPNLFLFFAGNFFIMEAMNTVIFWLVIYMKQVFNPSPSLLMSAFLGLNFGSFIFGLAAGPLTDRWGSGRVLKLAAGSLVLTILTLGWVKQFWMFAGVGCLGGGFAFAGIWTAGRKRVVELSPAKEVGGYFGFYNLTTKVSVIWSLLFSIVADRLGFQAALAGLLIPSGLGFLFLSLSNRTD